MESNTSHITVKTGIPWFTLWLFTVAFAHLGLGQCVLALVLWPYYLGNAIGTR